MHNEQKSCRRDKSELLVNQNDENNYCCVEHGRSSRETDEDTDREMTQSLGQIGSTNAQTAGETARPRGTKKDSPQ
jgi:hypothetical protein